MLVQCCLSSRCYLNYEDQRGAPSERERKRKKRGRQAGTQTKRNRRFRGQKLLLKQGENNQRRGTNSTTKKQTDDHREPLSERRRRKMRDKTKQTEVPEDIVRKMEKKDKCLFLLDLASPASSIRPLLFALLWSCCSCSDFAYMHRGFLCIRHIFFKDNLFRWSSNKISG